jgi:peptidoglycan/LPS O-acetylase OafA/YrhL
LSPETLEGVVASSSPVPPPLTRRRRDLPALTGVRFLAAWYVVMFHALPGLARRYPVPKWMATFFSNGYLAVGLFFVLSGFILAYTYEGQIDAVGSRRRFWEARFARIYPVYFLSLAMSYWFAVGLPVGLPVGTRLAVLDMVQSWNPFHPDMAGAWNYPAWTLSAEAFFYICFPFVVPWLSRRGDRALFWLTALLLLICVFGHTPVKGLGDWKSHAAFFERFVSLPVLRIPEFLVGVVMGLIFLRREPGDKQVSRPLRVYPAVLLTLAVLSLFEHNPVSPVILPFSVLVYELARGGSLLARFLSTRAMVLLGGASYSVYLLRYPVTSWTRLLFSHASSRFARLGELAGPLILVIFSILYFSAGKNPRGKRYGAGSPGPAPRDRRRRVRSATLDRCSGTPGPSLLRRKNESDFLRTRAQFPFGKHKPRRASVRPAYMIVRGADYQILCMACGPILCEYPVAGC